MSDEWNEYVDGGDSFLELIQGMTADQVRSYSSLLAQQAAALRDQVLKASRDEVYRREQEYLQRQYEKEYRGGYRWQSNVRWPAILE